MKIKTDILLTALLMTCLLPIRVWTQGMAPARAAAEVLFAQGQPFEQDITMTAYYSPLPDQCCYVKGNFAADVLLNGEGHHGADGTPVYPGMVAAPPSYPYGTRIVIPGIGTVTVHDRGGAIQEWKSSHRIDLWAGYGEEGLARALAFGVQHVHAVVYPPQAPAPAESINLAALPAPPDQLKPYITDGTTLFDIHAVAGQVNASVQFLQERLQKIGYLEALANGSFGPATQLALKNFYADAGVTEPIDHLTENGAAAIEAAFHRVKAIDPIAEPVDVGSSPARVMEAQRTLRFLGFYKGRTNGQYDDVLQKAVAKFQKEQGIIASDQTSGAGRIGPQTRKTIIALWRRAHVSMGVQRLLAMHRVDKLLADRGYDIQEFLSKGDHGDTVRLLQKFLASKGYLGIDGVTGKFGDKTEQALIAYQKDSGIIKDLSDPGAGYAGPATLARVRQDVRHTMLQIVRAKGWAAV